jgi:HPt (histidine-containing phosphotransfer) domain-containing protein
MGADQNTGLVDFSYIMELGGGKPTFIKQVLEIFLENTPPGINQLEQLIRNTNKWDAISKQAHALKSSVDIVKIHGMRDRFHQIELLAKDKKHKPLITKLLDEIISDFTKAEVIIRKKMEEAPE